MHFMDTETMINESLLELYDGFTNLILVTVGGMLMSIIGIFLLKKEFVAIKN